MAVLLAILVASPVAIANRYTYKVAGGAYEANALLDGGHLTGGCSPNVDALWSGEVNAHLDPLAVTRYAGADEAALVRPEIRGNGHLEIKRHGTSGYAFGYLPVKSDFTGRHDLTTACDASGSVTETKTTPCAAADDAEIFASVHISGGVGTRLKLSWDVYFVPLSAGGDLVPDVFSCVEPFKFPSAECDDGKSTLAKVTAKHVRLPFGCLGTTSVPPPGSGYTKYGTSAAANGYIKLLRTKPR